MRNDSEIGDVIQQETRRGKRPIDIEERCRRKALQRDFLMHLRLPTEEEFREAMRALGVRDGSQKMNEALQVWRTFREV
jgi:hypothetical protein